MRRYMILLLIAVVAALGLPAGDAAAQQGGWQFCSQERGFCQVRGTANVRFGAGNRWVFRTVTNGIPCNNEAFGSDPAYGVAKVCEVNVGGGRGGEQAGKGGACAREGGWCAFEGNRRVHYGTPDRFVTRMARGGIECSNNAFGTDPAYGSPKVCWVD